MISRIRIRASSRLYRSQILHLNIRLKALDEIYNIYTCVFGEKRTRIQNKIMKMCVKYKTHTFAPLGSDRKTMKSASGKRPPDEAHGPGEETNQTTSTLQTQN